MRSSKDLYGVDPKRWKRMAYEDVWKEKLKLAKDKLDDLLEIDYMNRCDADINQCKKDIAFCEAQLKELE